MHSYGDVLRMMAADPGMIALIAGITLATLAAAGLIKLIWMFRR